MSFQRLIVRTNLDTNVFISFHSINVYCKSIKPVILFNEL